MPDVQYLDDGIFQAVHDKVWQRRTDQFAGAFLASEATKIWKAGQLLYASKDTANGFQRCFVVALGNVQADMFKVGAGLGRPSNRRHC